MVKQKETKAFDSDLFGVVDSANVESRFSDDGLTVPALAAVCERPNKRVIILE